VHQHDRLGIEKILVLIEKRDLDLAVKLAIAEF
jgi:hypothetical protein